MRNIVFIVLFALPLISAKAQSTRNFYAYGGTVVDEPKGAVVLPDGSRVIVSVSTSKNGDVNGALGGYDAWLVKTDSSGQIIWEKSYGGSYDDYPQSIQRTSDNGFVIAGETQSLDGHIIHTHLVYDTLDNVPVVITNSEFWILKLDSNGAVQWSKTYGGYQHDYAYSVIQTQDGGYFVTGTTISVNNGDVSGVHGPHDSGAFGTKPNDVWVVKLDASGDLEWSRAYGGDKDELGIRAIQTADLGYIIGARSKSRDGDVTGNTKHSDTIYWDYWVFKTDQNGALIWNKNFGGTLDDEIMDMAVLKDGTLAIAGQTTSNDGDVSADDDPMHFWVVALDKSGDGNYNWMRVYGGIGTDLLGSITATADGGFILGGGTETPYPDIHRAWPGFGGLDGWMLKISATGEPEWDKSIGGSSFDMIHEIVQKDDGSYLAVASTYSYDVHAGQNHGWVDVLLVEVSAVTAVQTTTTMCEGSSYYFPSRFHGDSLLWAPGKYLHSINMGTYDSTIVLTLYVTPMDFLGITANGSELEAEDANADAYQWINCATGLAIPNETNGTYTPAKSGDYAVVVTKNGCSDTSLCRQVIFAGLPDMANGEVLAYPNPASQTITLIHTVEGQQANLTDILGRQLMRFETLAGKTQLDVSGLTNGYYFIHLTDPIGTNTTLKVYINR